jgi:hypothetical protein
MEVPTSSENRSWLRGLRPLFYWLLLVLLLFGIRMHQRLMEQTRLDFTVTLQGKPLYDAVTTFDGKLVLNGQRITLGSHTFVITHPKGETFSTNIFIWYGEHNLGAIDLKRTMGTLSVTADPSADWLVIRGPEWSVTLTNSSGLTKLVPTDAYEIEADYPYWRKTYSATVFANQTTPCPIAPHFGGLKLDCNQSDATYQLQSADGQLISSGILPATASELPSGNYKLTATHHGHQRTDTLVVKADTTTAAQIDFQYGVVVFETSPAGAMVATGDGRSWGETPLTLPEMLPGSWTFILQRSGYQSVQVSVNVEANQTSNVSTNLVSETYLHAMNAARQYMAAVDYDRALQAAGDALVASPGDADAMTLQREATGLGIIQRAKKLAQQGDYIGGGKELTLALQSLPENAEVMRLLADFKQHEPEQIERLRMERLERPKKSFDAALAYLNGAALFESHELKTSKSATETFSAIETQLKSVPPSFQIVRSETTGEIFVIEATQDFSGGSRRCMIVGGQSKDDETQIYFEVVESKKVGFMDQPLGALVGAMPSKYTLIYPSDLQTNVKLKNQITEGVSNVTARIQSAIGQTPEVQSAVP